jgi:hypothetical protein
MIVKLFKDLPNGTVFRILKESTRARKAHAGIPASCPAPEQGLFVKCSNSSSASAFRKAKTIILGLTDVVQVVKYPPREKNQRPVRA